MRKFITLSFISILIVGCTTKPKEFDYSKADFGLIDALVLRGSDVNKEHWVSYTIDCKTEQQVNEVLAKAISLGFEDEYVSYSQKRNSWSSTVSKSMKLNVNDIALNRALLLPFTPQGSCYPLAFGASVVK